MRNQLDTPHIRRSDRSNRVRRSHKINLSRKVPLGLPDLANRVGRAKLLVSGDTGVAHLATAYRTPSVLLFGPTPPHRCGPCVDPRLHTVLWHGADDRPGNPHGALVDPALAAIEVSEVMAAIAAAPDPATGRTPA